MEVVRIIAGRRRGAPTDVAFLEFARPTIEDAVAELAARGIQRIVCQPAMLLGAGHVKNDVPRLLKSASRCWPDLEISMGAALRLHPKLLELCQLRISQAMNRREPQSEKTTALLVVGRGSSDPDANAEVALICRLLQQERRFGGGTACFSGIAKPLLPELLETAARRGFRRIIVLPYLLFSGALLKKIHSDTLRAAASHADIDIYCAPHLGVHELLADVIEERSAGPLEELIAVPHHLPTPHYRTAVPRMPSRSPGGSATPS